VPTPSERCEHIQSAIDAIFADINGHAEQAFLANNSLQAACCYRLIIIGEAGDLLLRSSVNEITQHAPNLLQSLSSAHRMRSVLAHHYHRVDPMIVWHTIQIHLPQMSADMRALRAALP
jgi:uncharacterized protein with HEPN domain